MTKKTLTLAILTSLCGAPLLASAQPHGFGPGKAGKTERFEQLDADKNGSISPAELQADIARHFAQLDANKDGRVTKAEAEAFANSKRKEHAEERGARAQQRFAQQDSDKDGRLSRQELSRMPGDMFERLDLNGDGYVTKDEMKEAHEARREEHAKRFEDGRGKRFERLDTDHNGVVDQAELAAHAKQRFERMDTDKNGVLSKDELGRPGCHGERGEHGKRGMREQARGEHGKRGEARGKHDWAAARNSSKRS